ncbi:MAG: chitobiase/beta-hexosaminidase C-terminal domain-containing protein [Muribaculaceae bacterium]|nr:chitobiase/beta-hexosaminidase C-terminal domain-containing protein [Muribaculaceae bacterium]
MKRLLTFLTLLTVFIGVGWAADVTFDATTDKGSVSANGIVSGGDTFTKDGITITSSNGPLGNGSNYRVYTGGTLTITSTVGNITNVTVTCTSTGTSNYGPSKFYVATGDPGSYQPMSSNANGYWTGSSATVILTASDQVRIKTIVVTYTAGTTPTTYSITGTGAVTGGNVTASATSNITAGTSITITATPSTGYELSNLTVDGNDVTSSVNSNNEYTFSMPSHNVSVSATFTEQSTPQPSGPTRFERINSTSQLEAGKRYIFVYEATPAGMGAISTTSTKYGTSVTGSSNITVTNGVATLPSGSAVKQLTLGGNATDGWTFDLDGALLNHTGTKNTLTTGTSNTTWTIAFSGNNATITNKTNTTRVIKYNSTSGQERFACYESGQENIQLYKEVEAVTSSDVYIVGQINGHDSDPWVSTEGLQLTYNSSTDTYGADIYCTGMKNNEDNGWSYFIFTKSLPFDWNDNTNFYGSGADGGYWGIGGQGESAFGEEIPLYETSTNVYRLPAGLYTVTVDLDYTGHEYTTKSVSVTKRDVTMTISPSSATFTDTRNVTMASNLTELGGKIYYTTDGSDPRDQYSSRQEYTEQLTISATTNFKAVAVLGCIYSDVVEKTYTKAPAAPEITPASCTFNEPLTVSITAESGATIYYTTDGSTPTNESTQYTGPFTVSTTTTVKARAYVGEAYSNVAEATYTYSNVQPSTGDFELVTSASQLVAGNEYIILEAGGNYAMGEVSNNKGQATDDYTLTGTLGASGSKVAAGSGVNVLTLGGESGAWTLQQSDNSYINITSNNTNVTESTSATTVTIEIDNSNYATIKGYSTRQILYQIKSGSNATHIFGNYATSNANGADYEKVYLYTRASNAVQNPVFSPVPGIYNVDIDVTISCATDGATIYYTTDGTDPTATTGTEYTGEMVVSETTTFKAIAVKDSNTSSVVTAAYTINKSTEIATVTLDYSEPFTAGIGDFTIDNVSGFSPVWSLDGNYGVKGTSYSNGTNYAATSRLISPIIDMTGAVLPTLTFSHQINKYFNDVTSQCKVFIRETSNGTSGTWKQIPITFSDPVAAGGWTNDIAVVDLTDVNGINYADKKVQISFLYTNPTEGSGAGTWEIQNFVVADNSEYRMVNNIAEFLALDNGITAKFKNPVTVLYDYAQYSSSQYHEYIWVKDESGYMQFYMVPTLNSDENSGKDGKAAYYENGDIIPAGFVVTKNYYEYGKYVQAYTNDALNAGFEQATQKGLADPEHMDFDVLHALDATNQDNIDTWCNRYITLEKIKITSKSGKNFSFAKEDGTVNACVGYNKYNGDGSLLKDGTTPADVTVPAASNTFYNVTGIIQLWQGGWEFMPIEFTEWKADEVTLRKLCADGVETHEYKISNNLLGVYASKDGTKLWVKDDTGQSIWKTGPDATYKDNFPIDAEDNTRLEQANYDQSNWCELIMADENAALFVGKIISGGSIQGRFTEKTNPTLDGVSLDEDAIYSAGSYAPNYYMPANFYGNQDCRNENHTDNGHYFFMAPKPQEYAMVVWAIWDSQNNQMIISDDPTKNVHGFKGSFSINLNMNDGITDTDDLHDGVDDGFAYNFSAIIRKVSSSKDGNSANYMIYPVDLNAPTDPATAIESILAGNGEVKSVKFYNVAGIESNVPFQGINIVVTEYTDGTRTTTKMLKR